MCGTEQYARIEGQEGPDPREEGVVIRRVPALPGGADVHRHRVLRQAWFCAWASAWLFLRRPPDLFVSQTNPPAAVPVIALAARLWRKPLILVAMDLYPEILIAHGTFARQPMLARAATAMFNWAYRAATIVVALGPVMRDRIRAKGVTDQQVVEISNWATGALGVTLGDDNRLRGELGLGDSFVLVYSGNLGVGHEFETLLRGIAMAREHVPALRLVFFGSGARLLDVRESTRALGLEGSVSFLPPVAAGRLPESLGLANLGVVTLRAGFEGLMVPSKLLGYVARGIPVLYVGPPSDTATLVQRHRCGFCVPNGDAEGIARVIITAYADRERLAAMGRAGQEAYERGLAREHALVRYEEVFRRCLELHRT